MKKAIIIHAWESSPKEHWYQDEKIALEKLGYEVRLPEMPGGKWPKLSEWLPIIEAQEPDEETVFIGHSLGTPAILRYLEKSGQKVDKVISMAGFARDLGYDETRNFVEKPFDWDKLRGLANKFVIIAEKNDPYVPLDVAKEIAVKTGGEWVPVDGNIHFDKMDLDLINRWL